MLLKRLSDILAEFEYGLDERSGTAQAIAAKELVQGGATAGGNRAQIVKAMNAERPSPAKKVHEYLRYVRRRRNLVSRRDKARLRWAPDPRSTPREKRPRTRVPVRRYEKPRAPYVPAAERRACPFVLILLRTSRGRHP